MSEPTREATIVQPILLDKTGSHEDSLLAAALASVQVHQGNPTYPTYEPWLAGSFTKTVRRGSAGQLDRAVAEAVELGKPYREVRVGSSRAVAFAPEAYSDFWRGINKLQVSGTDFTRAAQGPAAHSIYVWGELTTGKAAAQAAHALWLAYLLDGDSYGPLAAQGPQDWAVEPVSAQKLEALARLHPERAIRDNGLTEVAPQTLTAVVG